MGFDLDKLTAKRQPESRLRLWWMGLPIVGVLLLVLYRGAVGDLSSLTSAVLVGVLAGAFLAFVAVLVWRDAWVTAAVVCPNPTLFLYPDRGEMHEYGVRWWSCEPVKVAVYPHGSRQWDLYIESRQPLTLALAREDGWYRLNVACYPEKRRSGDKVVIYHYYRAHLTPPRELRGAKQLSLRLTPGKLASLGELRAVCERAEAQQIEWGQDVRQSLYAKVARLKWRIPRRFGLNGRLWRNLYLYTPDIVAGIERRERERAERRRAAGTNRRIIPIDSVDD